MQRLSKMFWCRIIIQACTKKLYEVVKISKNNKVYALHEEGWRVWPVWGYVLPRVGWNIMGEDMPPSWPCSKTGNNLFIAYRTGFCTCWCEGNVLSLTFCSRLIGSLLNCSVTWRETYRFIRISGRERSDCDLNLQSNLFVSVSFGDRVKTAFLL